MKIILLCFFINIFINKVYTQFNNNHNNYEQAVINNLNYFNKVQNTNQNQYYNNNNVPQPNTNQRKNYPSLEYSDNHKPFVITEIAENRGKNPNSLAPQGRSLGRSSFPQEQLSNNEPTIITNRFRIEESDKKTFQYQYSKGWSVHEAINVDNIVLPHLEDHKNVQYSMPNTPDDEFYQKFYNIYNFVENQGQEELNQYEMETINDDFNGRSLVAPGQYPHMAAIGFLSNEDTIEYKCGGSLISKLFVVTAAHCCYLNGETPIIVKLGIINLKEQLGNSNPQKRAIKEIIVHPSYNSTLNYHDIALLKLQTPVDITKFVRPILLWTSDHIPYERVFTMGYGSTSFAKAPTNILTELSLSLTPLDKCKTVLPPDEKTPHGIVESQICGRDLEKNRDTCQGDSGGPLQLNLEHHKGKQLMYRYYLVGVISYGEFCGSKTPGVYTRVSSYCKWIASIVWPKYFKSL
ncbi:serine protease snk-like [Cochliomyia hominivorax]